MIEKSVYNKLKWILNQRGMLTLKDVNIIVYPDGVSNKLWQLQGVLQKYQDVTRLPFVQIAPTLP